MEKQSQSVSVITALEIGLESTTDLMSEAPRRAQVELNARATIIRAAIDSASAAAPQVVADEREAFHVAFLKWNGFHTEAELDAEWSSGLSGIMFREGMERAAAPVQAQEPVAEFMGMAWSEEKGAYYPVLSSLKFTNVPARTKLYTAPVQPVAVPDVDPVAWMRKRDITELVCCEPEDDGWMPLFAAPAAQGDDITVLARAIDCLEILDKRPRPMCRDCADECSICPHDGLDCDMRKLIADARAAIAAKAAS